MVSVDQQAPSQALLAWLSWRAGAFAPVARVVVMTTTGTDDLDLQTADYAAKVQASVYPESFGVARVTRGRPAQAIVFARRPLAVEPLPKAYPPGAPITLKVKPLDAFTELALLADDEGGGVVEERFALSGDAGGTFSVTHKAPSKPGRYFLEVTGLDPRTLQAMPENPWRRTLLWVPVYVGVPEPAAPDAFVRAPGASPADVTTWGSRVVELYDEARAKAGKKAIATDGRVTALAAERSGVVARAGREPPPDVVLADKIAAAGYPPHDYDESHARIDGVEDYVALRLLQPSARRRLLGADAVVVGVGLTPNAPNAKGEIDYTLVEDDVEPAARFDVARDRPEVYAALDAPAKAEGRAAYKHDEDVSKVVQAFADEVCHGAKRPNQMKPFIDKARGVGDKYHQWGTPVWRVGYDFTRWEASSLFAKNKEAPMVYAEVGICQGDLPGKPGASYVVAIQYAYYGLVTFGGAGTSPRPPDGRAPPGLDSHPRNRRRCQGCYAMHRRVCLTPTPARPCSSSPRPQRRRTRASTAWGAASSRSRRATPAGRRPRRRGWAEAAPGARAARMERAARAARGAASGSRAPSPPSGSSASAIRSIRRGSASPPTPTGTS